MFGWLKPKTPEIEQLIERIEAANRRMPESLAPIAKPLLDQLSSIVRSKWSAEDRMNYAAQIRAGEMHEAFIYNFLVHTVANKLESGSYHIYRGVLSQQGHQHKALFEHAINTMTELGGYTKLWADENLRAPVYKGIKEVG